MSVLITCVSFTFVLFVSRFQMTKPHIGFNSTKSTLSAGGSWNLQNPSSRATWFYGWNHAKPLEAGARFELASPGHEPGKDPLLHPAMSNFCFEKSKKSLVSHTSFSIHFQPFISLLVWPVSSSVHQKGVHIQSIFYAPSCYTRRNHLFWWDGEGD